MTEPIFIVCVTLELYKGRIAPQYVHCYCNFKTEDNYIEYLTADKDCLTQYLKTKALLPHGYELKATYCPPCPPLLTREAVRLAQLELISICPFVK